MKMGWTSTTLGEAFEMYQPHTLAKSEMDSSGTYKVYGANGIIGTHNEFNHESPQVLITCRGATCGTINVSEAKSWINGNAMVVKPKNDNVDIGFLKHLLICGVDLNIAITGAAQPQITRQSLSPIRITLPPITEQKRIAQLLDTVDRIFRLRESAIAKLDALAQSVFVKRMSELCCSEKLLNEIAEMYQPKTISANELIPNGKYVVYGANGIIGRYDKFNHEEDEVLVTCRGATCGTVNRSEAFSWITGNAMVVKPLKDIATKDFLQYYFKFMADFSSVITGAAQPQITRQTLSRLYVALPNLDQQHGITKIVKEIYAKHELMNFSQIKLKTLTHSLQHQLFAVN